MVTADEKEGRVFGVDDAGFVGVDVGGDVPRAGLHGTEDEELGEELEGDLAEEGGQDFPGDKGGGGAFGAEGGVGARPAHLGWFSIECGVM